MWNALAACQDPVEIVIDCARAQLDRRPAIRVAVRKLMEVARMIQSAEEVFQLLEHSH